MTLTAGTRLGSYEIVVPVGSGGSQPQHVLVTADGHLGIIGGNNKVTKSTGKSFAVSWKAKPRKQGPELHATECRPWQGPLEKASPLLFSGSVCPRQRSWRHELCWDVAGLLRTNSQADDLPRNVHDDNVATSKGRPIAESATARRNDTDSPRFQSGIDLVWTM